MEAAGESFRETLPVKTSISKEPTVKRSLEASCSFIKIEGWLGELSTHSLDCNTQHHIQLVFFLNVSALVAIISIIVHQTVEELLI